jgi:hypothetical protein
MNYKEVLNAELTGWKREARKLIEEGAHFVVINLSRPDVKHLTSLAQEFDFTCMHLDKSHMQYYPEVQPTKLGLVHRKAPRRK